MAIEVIWAKPGPEADEAWRQYCALASEIADRVMAERLERAVAVKGSAPNSPEASGF